MIIQQLINAGLEEKEAKVYSTLLELGEATIAEITKKASVKRSTVYEMLELLKKRGLLSQSKRGKRPVFIAESPKKILEALDEKRKTLESSMPEILSVMNLIEKKPKIRYFEGLTGVKEIFEDTLRHPDSEILTWWPYPYLSLNEDYFWENYNPQRIEKKIWVRSLVPDTDINRAMSARLKEKWITTTKLIKDEAFSSFDIEIKIYGKNKVGIISCKEDLGIIIESKKIYQGIKAIFEALWERLPE